MEHYLCARCREKFPFEQIRYDRNHKIVCKGCLGVLEKEEQRKNLMSARDYEKVRFICMECRFKFSLKNDCKRFMYAPFLYTPFLTRGSAASATQYPLPARMVSMSGFCMMGCSTYAKAQQEYSAALASLSNRLS